MTDLFRAAVSVGVGAMVIDRTLKINPYKKRKKSLIKTGQLTPGECYGRI